MSSLSSLCGAVMALIKTLKIKRENEHDLCPCILLNCIVIMT
jgi:hypothetical protein